MEDVKEKRCPFRVCQVERPPMLRGNGTTVIQEFYHCMGEECAAYYRGGCLRLVPPALVIGDSPLRMRADLTDEEVEKLREELRKAPIMPAPVEPEEPQPSCANCGYYENKAGCKDCIYNPANRFRKETMPSNWVPKSGEVPW